MQHSDWLNLSQIWSLKSHPVHTTPYGTYVHPLPPWAYDWYRGFKRQLLLLSPVQPREWWEVECTFWNLSRGYLFVEDSGGHRITVFQHSGNQFWLQNVSPTHYAQRMRTTGSRTKINLQTAFCRSRIVAEAKRVLLSSKGNDNFGEAGTWSYWP